MAFRFSRPEVFADQRKYLNRVPPPGLAVQYQKVLTAGGELLARNSDYARRAYNKLIEQVVEEYGEQQRVLDGLQGTYDYLGSSAWGRYESESLVGTAGVLNVDGTVVPVGEVWYIPYAHTEHNDATNRTLILEVGGSLSGPLPGVSLATTTAVVADATPLPAPRPVMLGAGLFLKGRVRSAITVTASVLLKYYFLRLKQGEYTYSP